MTAVTTRYRVTGMDCPPCVAKIEKAARSAPGVVDVCVSIASGEMALSADGAGRLEGAERAVAALGYHLELVAKGREVTLHVMDGKMAPLDVSGATGTATVLAAGKPERVELKPRGKEALVGQAAAEVGPGARVVASVTLPGAKPAQARFEVGR